MAKITVCRQEGLDWVQGKPNPGSTEPTGASRQRHPGNDGEPQLFEVRTEPGMQAEVHAHEKDEVIYIVAGQMLFGQHTLNPGDSIMIPGNRLYSFRAGPDGLQFLNFRGQKDVTYYRKDEFQKLQTLEGGERAEYRDVLIRRRAEQRGWG